MTDTALPMYELGLIPNLTMQDYRLAFRINMEKIVGPTARVNMQQAMEIARATLQIAQTPPEEHEEELMKRLVEHLRALAKAGEELGNLASKAGLAQLVKRTLFDARNSVATAEAHARQLPFANTGKLYNRLRQGCCVYAESAAAGSMSAIKTLSERLIEVTFQPHPSGRVSLDGLTGLFEYEQGADDNKPFNAIFSAIVDGQPFSQNVTITPIPPPLPTDDKLIDQRITGYVLGTQLENRYTPEGDKKKERFVTGLDVTLGQDLFNESWSDITVYGHIVRVSGKLEARTAPTNLTIYARYVIFAPGTSIDVSGKEGAPLPKAVADGGTKDGEDGKDGEKGNKGEDAGTIRIVAEQIIGEPTLIANGGPGGPGQKGGQGAKGKQGDFGKNQTETTGGGGDVGGWSGTKTEGTPGGKGGKGGKGGRAGQRGHHGNAGKIYIGTLLPHGAKFQADPGQHFLTAADEEGEPGSGGPRGDGGIGGSREGGRYRYDNGLPGDLGDSGDKAPPAERGEEGIISRKIIDYPYVCSKLVNQESYGSYGTSDSTLLSMTVFAAERLCLNAASEQDIEALRSILNYLLRLTATPVQGAEESNSRIQGEVHKRCSALRANLDRGLDYFGKSHDFVHSLSFETNEDFYTKFKEIAKDLEKDYDKFWDKNKSDEDKREAIRKQIDRADSLANKLKLTLNQLTSEAEEDRTLIESLTEKAITQKSVVRRKAVEFEEELRRKQFFDILVGCVNIAWSFVTVGINVKPLLTNGFAVLNDISSTEKPKADKKADEEKDEKAKHKELATAAFGKVKGSLESIYKDYNQYFQNDEPNDLIKLGLEKEDQDEFDKEIDRFLDMGKAKEVKKEMHEYFDLVTQRNKAILKRDSEVQQAYDLQEQIEAIEKENTNLRNQMGGNYDPKLPVFVKYMISTTQLLKSFIIETLYIMSRSADYYTLESRPLRLMDYRISTLEVQYAEILKRLQEATEHVGPRGKEALSLIIDDPDKIEQLKKYKPVWISVPLNTNNPPIGPFAFKERPMVKQIECYFRGLESPDSKLNATVTIENAGSSYVYNEITQKPWSFTHARRTISFEYDIADPDPKPESGDLTENGKFIMLSPFGLWGVLLREKEGQNEQLDLSALKHVELRFTVVSNETHIHSKV